MGKISILNVTTQLLLFQTHFESANYSKSVSKVKGNREEIKGKREKGKSWKKGKKKHNSLSFPFSPTFPFSLIYT
ncbi:MAG: hypothetical protein V1749_05470 [Candidatus Desantisbacteria bacterium]